MTKASLICLLCLFAAPTPAVELARYAWGTPIEAKLDPQLGPSNLHHPFIMPNGDILAVTSSEGEDKHVSVVLTYFDRNGTIKKTVRVPGPNGLDNILGAAQVDRKGRLFLATTAEVASGQYKLRIARYSPEGELETTKDHAVGDHPLVGASVLERSGDLLLVGTNSAVQLGYAALANENGELAWQKTRGHVLADVWQPSAITIDQHGDVIVAGAANDRDPASLATDTNALRVIKYAADGNEIFGVNVPAKAKVALRGCEADADGNIALVAKIEGGGAVLWSLDGVDGHPRWQVDDLNTPSIDPKWLIVDGKRFIYLMLNNVEETQTHAYVVKFSLGGKALYNVKAYNDPNVGDTMTIDDEGEVYVAGTAGSEGASTTAYIARLSPVPEPRYVIRRTATSTYKGMRLAVNARNGDIAVLTTITNEQGIRPAMLCARQAPIAKYETYKFPGDTQSKSPASVLSNDQYIEGAEMKVTKGAEHGRIEMALDGTFTYTPNNGYRGDDQFRYQLTRGALFWYAAIVKITVE